MIRSQTFPQMQTRRFVVLRRIRRDTFAGSQSHTIAKAPKVGVTPDVVVPARLASSEPLAHVVALRNAIALVHAG